MKQPSKQAKYQKGLRKKGKIIVKAVIWEWQKGEHQEFVKALRKKGDIEISREDIGL